MTVLTFGLLYVSVWCQAAPQDGKRTYTIAPQTVAAIREAAPDAPVAKPAEPRKVLVYGRMPTHPESVVCCFEAMTILGEKTGAFQAVGSGDPQVFRRESLQQFDAVIMNNTHERYPMLPMDIDRLSVDQQAAARALEPQLKRNLLEFVADGKGLVGIHGATAGNVQWPEFVQLFGAQYMSHFTDTVWVRPEEPGHPLCGFLEGESFEVHDEIYLFRKALTREPFSREGYHVLYSLDLSKTPDPGRRADGDYVVSWIRPYEQGRIFYTSLGHCATAYTNPAVLKHYLAVIQYAIGDLPAE